jgi:GNAT superfamily N-acetyltransferase
MYDYQLEPQLTAQEFIDLLQKTSLGERRPLHDFETMDRMLRQADIILTARHGGKLIGISRAISDFAFCTYLSDLAVDEAYQRQGIGKILIQMTHEAAGLNTALILISAPKAVEYYPHIGMTKHESCWFIPRQG